MSLTVDIDITPSGEEKLSSDKWKIIQKKAIGQVTLQAEAHCKKTAPYLTGNLRRSHTSNVTEEKGEVHNSTNYWIYVVFGTRYQKPQNYPAQVLDNMVSSGEINAVLKRLTGGL